MQDESLVELCKNIYRKHREAIDLVVEYGMTSMFLQAAEDILGVDEKYETLYSSPSQIWFLPDSWKILVPENGIMWTFLKRPVSVCCWFVYSKGTLYSHFEVCKMDDPSLRLKCVKSLKAAGFTLGKRAFLDQATYSRFYGKTVKINDETDYDEMHSAIEKLLRKAKDEFPKVEKVFQTVFK